MVCSGCDLERDRESAGAGVEREDEMKEAEVRALRALVFGKDCTDGNWDAVKNYWMRADSIEWLKEKAKRPLKDYSK